MAGARSSSCRQHNSSPSSLALKADRKSSQYFRALSHHLKMIHFSSWPGHSRPKDGVASARLCPGHPRLPDLSAAKTWMPGIADKFTQSAQGRLLWPGMTSFATESRLGSRSQHPPFGRYPPENGLVMLAY